MALRLEKLLQGSLPPAGPRTALWLLLPGSHQPSLVVGWFTKPAQDLFYKTVIKVGSSKGF